MGDIDLAAIQRRLAATTGDRWELDLSAEGGPAIAVQFPGGRHEVMRVKRDGGPAGINDLEFVAQSRRDLERLIEGEQNATAALTNQELAEIQARGVRASRPPWTAFLERDGGMGGSNMIRVSDDDNEPDLYLWLGDALAPDADFEFVAAARQDIPNLLMAAKARKGTDGDLG
jgi:hypothetical protein